MKPASVLVLASISVPFWTTTTAPAAMVDFESVPLPAIYGGIENDNIGQVVLQQDGISMSVEQFFSGDFQAFYRAEVGQGQEFFPTTPLGLNNISVRFGFDDVGFNVNQASVEFLELGGTVNFAVNDQPVLQMSSFADLPSDVAPFVDAAVENGSITLTGPIRSIQIGGAELVIDNVAAVPEPSIGILAFLGAAALGGLKRRQCRGS